MTFKRILFRICVSLVFLVVCFFAIWRVFDVEEKIRLSLQDYLSNKTGYDISIQSLKVRPTKLIAEDINLKTSSIVDLKAAEINIDFSFITLLSQPKKFAKAISGVSILLPELILKESYEDSGANSYNVQNTFQYKPFLLQNLKPFLFIKALIIVDGKVLRGISNTIADNINCKFLIESGYNANLNGTAYFPLLPNTPLIITGQGNFERGDFRIDCSSETNDLSRWADSKTLNKYYTKFENITGKVSLNFAITGEEELEISGNLVSRGLRFDFSPHLEFREMDLDGKIDGAAISITGSFNLNGLIFPVKSDFNLLSLMDRQGKKKVFTLDIINQVNLSQLQIPGQVPFLKVRDTLRNSDNGQHSIQGELDVSLNLEYENHAFVGGIQLESDSVLIKGVNFSKLRIIGSLDSTGIELGAVSSMLFGGYLEATGKIGFDNAEKFSWNFQKLWTESSSPALLNHVLPFLALNGDLEKLSGKWAGKASGFLTDLNEISGDFNPISLNLSRNSLVFDIDNNSDSINVSIADPNGDGAINLTVKLNEQLDINIVGEKLESIFHSNLNSTYYPESLSDYTFRVKSKGELNPSGSFPARSFNLKFQGFSRTEEKSFMIMGILAQHSDSSINQSGYNFKGNCNIEASNGRKFLNSLDFDVLKKSLKLNNFKTFEISNSIQKTEIMHAEGGMSFPGYSSERDSISITFRRFPFPEFVRLYKPHWLPGLKSEISGIIVFKRNGGFSKIEAAMQSSLSNDYFCVSDVNWSEEIISVKKFELIDALGERVFEMNGKLNYAQRMIDTLLLVTSGLSLEDYFQAKYPDEVNVFGGKLNSRLVLKGDMKSPDVLLDAHLMSGFLLGESGYWANLNVITSDGIYEVGKFDFGKGIVKLLDIAGNYNRENNSYLAQLTGRGVEFSTINGMFVNSFPFKEGKIDFNAVIDGAGFEPRLEANVQVERGKIGLLSFDNLYCDISSVESNITLPDVSIDSMMIDFGDSRANISGIIPMNIDSTISIQGEVEGVLMGLLHRIEKSFAEPKGNGSFQFTIGGSLKEPVLTGANLLLEKGSIDMGSVISQVHDLSIKMSFDSSGRLLIEEFVGRIEDGKFRFNNRYPIENEDFETIKIGEFDLGAITFTTNEDGIWLSIPGFMESEWGGYAIFSGKDNKGTFELQGPARNPKAIGNIRLRNATFTYPFIKKGKLSASGKSARRILNAIEWDGYIIPEWGCHYINEISGIKAIPLLNEFQEDLSSPFIDFDVKTYIDLLVDEEQEGLYFSGFLHDTFQISGDLTSSHGSVEYLDLNFQVNSVKVEFIPPELIPIISGEAATTVFDSTNIPNEIRLIASNTIEREKSTFNRNLIDQTSPIVNGELNEINIRLEDDHNHSQEQILALMGYSVEHLASTLSGLGGTFVENAMPFKRWTQALERNLERWLGLDMLEIEPQLARNLIERQIFSSADSVASSSGQNYYLTALNQSKITVGKYFNQDIYISYTALLQLGADENNTTRLGMVHNWDFTFRITDLDPNFFIGYRYLYDSLVNLDDHRLSLKYSFFLDK